MASIEKYVIVHPDGNVHSVFIDEQGLDHFLGNTYIAITRLGWMVLRIRAHDDIVVHRAVASLQNIPEKRTDYKDSINWVGV